MKCGYRSANSYFHHGYLAKISFVTSVQWIKRSQIFIYSVSGGYFERTSMSVVCYDSVKVIVV